LHPSNQRSIGSARSANPDSRAGTDLYRINAQGGSVLPSDAKRPGAEWPDQYGLDVVAA
jgi:hypothetical protein